MLVRKMFTTFISKNKQTNKQTKQNKTKQKQTNKKLDALLEVQMVWTYTGNILPSKGAETHNDCFQTNLGHLLLHKACRESKTSISLRWFQY